MSTTDTPEPTNVNQISPSGTKRAFFSRAGKACEIRTARTSPATKSSGHSTVTTTNPMCSCQNDQTQWCGNNHTDSYNALRQRMAEELSMAGLAPRSQQTYLAAVDRLAIRSRKPVEDLSENEVTRYLLNLRDNGAAQGTFKTNWFGLNFLYEHVLGRGWALFTKKRFASQSGVAFPESSLMSRCKGSWTPYKAPFIRPSFPLCIRVGYESARQSISLYRR